MKLNTNKENKICLLKFESRKCFLVNFTLLQTWVLLDLQKSMLYLTRNKGMSKLTIYFAEFGT